MVATGRMVNDVNPASVELTALLLLKSHWKLIGPTMKSQISNLARFACVAVALTGCTSENEHFCAKYSYFYKELTAPGILPIPQLRAQLEKEKSGSGADRERAKMALFVLADVDRDMKPVDEPASEYCLRRKRWEQYR